jgi:hypothetical protein
MALKKDLTTDFTGLDGELDMRDKRGMEFVAHAKTARVDQLAQLFAPELSPAIDDEPRRRLKKNEPKPPPKLKGGMHGWPQGRHQRVAATLPIVQDWVDLGMAWKLRPWRDHPMWIQLSPAGERWLGLSYTPIPFPAGELEHIYVINEIRLFLLRSTQIPTHAWISERELQQNEPQKVAEMELPHRPDGVMILEESGQIKIRGEEINLAGGERIAIEAERSRKNYKELAKDLPSLMRHYDRAWYFATPGAYDTVSEARERYLVNPADRARLQIFRLSDNWWDWKKEPEETP